jgi:hypothetical protein
VNECIQYIYFKDLRGSMMTENLRSHAALLANAFVELQRPVYAANKTRITAVQGT